MARGGRAVVDHGIGEGPQETVRSKSPSTWRPRWMIWPRIRAPSAFTASVMRRKGAMQAGSNPCTACGRPSEFGVTRMDSKMIAPTPPRARAT